MVIVPSLHPADGTPRENKKQNPEAIVGASGLRNRTFILGAGGPGPQPYFAFLCALPPSGCPRCRGQRLARDWASVGKSSPLRELRGGKKSA